MAEMQDPLDWQDVEAANDETGAIENWLKLADKALERRSVPEVEIIVDDSLAS